MAKYHFVKVGSVDNKDHETCWYFKPETFEQLYEHWKIYSNREIKTGIEEVTEHIINEIKGNLNDHYRTTWGSLIHQISEIKEQPYWKTIKNETDLLWKNRIKMWTDGLEFYLSDGLTVFMLTEGITEIKEELYKDELRFPEERYNIDDVRYIQWENGKHWYAKVGNFDIVVDGKQKWDSKTEAEKAARQYFINETYKKRYL